MIHQAFCTSACWSLKDAEGVELKVEVTTFQMLGQNRDSQY